MDNNWIVENLTGALDTWNGKLAEIWTLVGQSPQDFKGGGMWELAENINSALQSIGYGLLILFFAISIFKSALTFRDFRRPETSLKYFLKFVIAKTAVTYGMEIMTTLFTICGGVVSAVAGSMGNLTGATVSLPEEIKTSIIEVDFWGSIPLWLVTLLGSLAVWALSIIMILTVYSRFFKLYMYTALAPIPLSTFAGDATSDVGRTFIRSYLGVCLEGAVIVLACLIFSAFAGEGTSGLVDPTASAFTQVWSYIAEVMFNMLVLVGLVKGADRIVKEMFGL